MRGFALICGIYILALLVMPCSDVATASKNNIINSEIVQSNNHKSNHADFCSLFCTCNCCSTSANPKLISFYNKITKPVLVSVAEFPIQDISFISSYYGSIWQPPKLNA